MWLGPDRDPLDRFGIALWSLGVGGRADKILRVSADLVPDDLGERVAPLLPVRPPRRYRNPGRLPADDRAALRGIVYVRARV